MPATEPFGELHHAAEQTKMVTDLVVKATQQQASTHPPAAAGPPRAGLTASLVEHVYLLGLAVHAAQVTGPTSSAFRHASDALDDNSRTITTLVGGAGSHAGETPADAFLTGWRLHVNAAVSYAVAARHGDTETKNGVAPRLTPDLGSVVRLPPQDAGRTVDEYSRSLRTALDASATGKGIHTDTAYQHLRQAATAMNGVAEKIAGEHDASGQASLRASLTGLLYEHVYLVACSAVAVRTAGSASAAPASGSDTVNSASNTNSARIGDALAPLLAGETGQELRAAWQRHAENLLSYAGVAAAGGDPHRRVLERLEAGRAAVSSLLAKSAGGAVTEKSLADAMKGYSDALLAAVDGMTRDLNDHGVTVTAHHAG